MARPGPNDSHGERFSAPEAALIIDPQSGSGGWGPMPRKLSAARARIAVELEIEAATMSGLAIFGMIWRARIRPRVAPRTAAAVTYSCPRAWSTWPRVSRK